MASLRFNTPVTYYYDPATMAPLINGKIYFYQTGTSTPKNTYQDSALTVLNANPVVLDSEGKTDKNIFFTTGDYKVVLKNSDDVEIWTRDPVSGLTAPDQALPTIGGASDFGKTIAVKSDGSGYELTDKLSTAYTISDSDGGRILRIIDENAANANAADPYIGGGWSSTVGGTYNELFQLGVLTAGAADVRFKSTTGNLELEAASGKGIDLKSAMNNSAPQTIASATTCDISASTSNYVTISGTTTITSFGTTKVNCIRYIKFSGALTLTYNATSLILPGVANITTAAGDTCVALSDNSGNWTVLNYQRATGKPVAGGVGVELISSSTPTGVGTVSFTSIPNANYRGLLLIGDKLSSTSGSARFVMSITDGVTGANVLGFGRDDAAFATFSVCETPTLNGVASNTASFSLHIPCANPIGSVSTGHNYYRPYLWTSFRNAGDAPRMHTGGLTLPLSSQGITQFDINCAVGTFDAGSIYLYGIL